MTTIYRNKGAVHGFTVEWYRDHDGHVEFCDIHGLWVRSKMTRADLGDYVRAGQYERVEWTYYHAGFEQWDYRVAGPFVQTLTAGSWGITSVRADEIPGLVERGVLVEVPAP